MTNRRGALPIWLIIVVAIAVYAVVRAGTAHGEGPYVAVLSPHMSDCWNVARSTSSFMLICDKETAEDMAESLNAAHNRRNAPIPCDQDNCGKSHD